MREEDEKRNDSKGSRQHDLGAVRSELASLDRAILELAARRRDLARHVGELKEAVGSPTRDFSQERVVLERAREVADELGLPTSLSDELMQILIGNALRTQEQQRIRHSDTGSGKSVLVIGGAGRMGRWFVDFLSTQGFNVDIADPGSQVAGFTCHEDWRAISLDHDFIVVAAPLRASATILEELAAIRPEGIVFDIGSLKSPLADALDGLVQAGVRTTSIHPMFGPDTDLLSGKHVVMVDVGNSEATSAVRRLFASTMADLVDMTLAEHDRLISLILGLSHALNIAFFETLSQSGETADRLAGLSSTTFYDQLRVASRVADENPLLYFEIQHLNSFGLRTLVLLRNAVEDLEDVVTRGDEAAFAEMMTAGRRYLSLPDS